MPRLDKLTIKAQEALQAAQEMGARSGQQQIEPLHLLWALIAQTDGVVPPLLEKLGVSPATLASEVETQINRLPKVSDVSQQYLSPATNKILDELSTKPSDSRTNTFPPSTFSLASLPILATPRANCSLVTA